MIYFLDKIIIIIIILRSSWCSAALHKIHIRTQNTGKARSKQIQNKNKRRKGFKLIFCNCGSVHLVTFEAQTGKPPVSPETLVSSVTLKEKWKM